MLILDEAAQILFKQLQADAQMHCLEILLSSLMLASRRQMFRDTTPHPSPSTLRKRSPEFEAHDFKRRRKKKWKEEFVKP
jgi:hypothetical protein